MYPYVNKSIKSFKKISNKDGHKFLILKGSENKTSIPLLEHFRILGPERKASWGEEGVRCGNKLHRDNQQAEWLQALPQQHWKLEMDLRENHCYSRILFHQIIDQICGQNKSVFRHVNSQKMHLPCNHPQDVARECALPPSGKTKVTGNKKSSGKGR